MREETGLSPKGHIPISVKSAFRRVSVPRSGSVDSTARSTAGSTVKPKRFGKTAEAPFNGLSPEMARALDEQFPAPNPDVVKVRKVRVLSKGPSNPRTMLGVTLPPEVLYIAGVRQGDQVMISAWREGVIRIVRVPEGED